ncbi:MAG TPA: hypothetical protein VN667_17115 [Burkholderiales bacterium]|nr:hypothetical protein [Burkholderiales bacterium]
MTLQIRIDDVTAALLRRAAKARGRVLLDDFAAEVLHERLLELLANEDRFAAAKRKVEHELARERVLRHG